MSDLLRVSPLLPIGVDGFYSQEKLRAVRTQLNKFVRLDDTLLNERVDNILKKEELDSSYFVISKYEDNKMRKEARLTVKEYTGWLSVNSGKYIGWNFRKTIGIFMILPWLIGSIISLLIYIKTSENFYFKILFFSSTLTGLSSFLYLIWRYLWSKPTEYEMKNEYKSN